MIKTVAILSVIVGMTSSVVAAPPSRPVPLTAAQYNHMLSVEGQPAHMAVRDVRASYTSKRDREMDFTRASDDFWTVAYSGGFPGIILGCLIAAAPL